MVNKIKFILKSHTEIGKIGNESSTVQIRGLYGDYMYLDCRE
jgi:hypothetical protein